MILLEECCTNVKDIVSNLGIIGLAQEQVSSLSIVGHCLTDVPNCERDKLESPSLVKLLDSVDDTYAAFIDIVQDFGLISLSVVFCQRENESLVSIDQGSNCFLLSNR